MNLIAGTSVSSGITGILEDAGLTGVWPEVIDYAVRVVLVIVGFFIFKLIINAISKAVVKRLESKGVKSTFFSFIVNILKAVLWIIVILFFLQLLKVPLSPVVAAIGTLGLGVGLALKDHMANIAGGVMIAVNKQFEVGDYVSCAGTDGLVDSVELFFTKIRTVDNKIVTVPNSAFSSNSVTNYTKENMRRVDVTVGISYSADIEEVKNVLHEIMAGNDMIKSDPAPFTGVTEFGDSSVNLTIRAWADTADYWDVFFYINETLKKEFDARGIEIPFPQLDVHKI